MKEIVRKHILYGTVIIAYLILMTESGIGCLLVFLFGIPCPACGGTRAILSLLQFDLPGYFYYHPMAIPLCIAIWLMIHAKYFRRRRLMEGIALVIIVGNTILYFYRFDFLKTIV